MKKCYLILLVTWFVSLSLSAVTKVHIADPQTWNSSALKPYVGQDVSFDVPMYLIYSGGSTLSPSCVATINSSNAVSLYSAPKTSRPRVYSTDLVAQVTGSNNKYSLRYVSGHFEGNTRADILEGPDLEQIDTKGQHTLLVCAANLEYYLVKNFGIGYGPDNQKQHDAQRTKTKQALALINADIYGLCEIEQGTAALQEICYDLNTSHKNRGFTYVNNGTSSSAGSFTMSAFVYDSLKVRPIGEIKTINTEVKNRKYMQCFEELSTKETFVFSMNHFKAMSGGGNTEARRIAEANAINSAYDEYKLYCEEEDLLIMGDLNCYKNDLPISILLDEDARTDLHQYFHPEGSYSYCFDGAVDYLDHAICNLTLLPQVTGMQAYHINSDESDCTYDKSCNDGTMFRYSDHDPVLVGLRLGSTLNPINDIHVINCVDHLQMIHASGGYIRIYDRSGNLLHQELIAIEDYTVALPTNYHGYYIVHVFYNGTNRILKYICP